MTTEKTPRTEAGRAFLELSAKWRYYPPTTLEAADLTNRILAIETEAAREARTELLREKAARVRGLGFPEEMPRPGSRFDAWEVGWVAHEDAVLALLEETP